jgi:HNH endonuclease
MVRPYCPGIVHHVRPVAVLAFTILPPKIYQWLYGHQEDSVRLRRSQLCPIHRSLTCCGREAISKERRQRQMGVRRIDDPQHPRGYRELRSNGEMRKLLDRKIIAQNGICGICKEKFTDYSDVVPDHICPRGMGGAWRDDHPDNIQAVHWWCNGEKGSSRG